MTKILFSSDYHIGKRLKSHTTVDSRKQLSDALFQAAVNINSKECHPRCFKVCLGDLFDTYSNDEGTLLQGGLVLEKLNLCLAGNHDMANDNSRVGSLSFLGTMQRNPAAVASVLVGDSTFHVKHLDGVSLYSVPHHSTQSEFEEALTKAMRYADAREAPAGKRILLTHCNYGWSEGTATETSLNLHESDAEILLESFDYVLLGHEHTPVDHFDGRLKIVGSLHPTSFSDISDKRCLLYDAKEDSWISAPVWARSSGYREVTVNQLLENERPTIPQTVQFIKVVGSVLPERRKDLSVAIKKLWADHPKALAIGDFSTMHSLTSQIAAKLAAEDAHLTLPERIDLALAGSPLQSLWDEIYRRIK